MLQKILLAVLLLFAIVVGWMVYNTFALNSLQVNSQQANIDSVSDDCCNHLSRVIQFQTVSFDRLERADSNSWNSLISFLDNTYPLIHSHFEKHLINHYALLYIWRGTDTSLKPVLLLAHADVLPVEKRVLDQWKFSPFSGKIDRDSIYGRGALENKIGLVAVMEAAEKLLEDKFIPQRTVMFAFGCDEESGGQLGAAQIAAYLQSHHIQPEYILDEGGSSTDGIVPGVSKPVALVGTAEKGFASVSLTVNTDISLTAEDDDASAISVLSKAISNVTSHQFSAHITDPVHAFIRYLAPEMSFHLRFIFANSWLFHSVILHQYEETKEGNAMVRTTIMPVNVESGMNNQSEPLHAKAIIDYSILPGETAQSVLVHTREAVHDNRVKISLEGVSYNPSPVSPTNSFGFKTIESTIREVNPDVIVTPYLVLNQTDSYHYESICPNIYHYVPVMLQPSDLNQIRGNNEHVSVRNLKNAVFFYYMLLKNSDQKS